MVYSVLMTVFMVLKLGVEGWDDTHLTHYWPEMHYLQYVFCYTDFIVWRPFNIHLQNKSPVTGVSFCKNPPVSNELSKIDSQWEFATWRRELKPVLWDDLEKWDGMGGSTSRGHLWLIYADIWQKRTQYCKAIILQLKINNFLKINVLKQCFPSFPSPDTQQRPGTRVPAKGLKRSWLLSPLLGKLC